MAVLVAEIPPDKFSPAEWARERDDATITPGKVLAALSKDQKDKLKSAQERLKGAVATSERFKRGNSYSAARLALHQKIFDHFLSRERVVAAMPRQGEIPVFVMLGGRGGSGKSWFNGMVFDPSRCIVVDADEIKKMLPEYGGWNAAVVHEESTDIVDEILRYCREIGLNVVLDATLKSSDGALRKATDFKAKGFRLEAHYMHLPRQLAATRAIKRFCGQDSGRYVPIEVILENTANESNFDTLRKRADAWSFWDNDVALGDPPRYVSGEATPALR